MGETAGFESVITAVWKEEGFSPQPPPPSRKKGCYRASNDWQECGIGTWLVGTGPVPERITSERPHLQRDFHKQLYGLCRSFPL